MYQEQKTYWISGQSNPSGRAYKSAASLAWIQVARHTSIWQGISLGLQPLNIGAVGVAGNQHYPVDDQDQSANFFGMEVGLAWDWERNSDEELALFKYAIGSKAMLSAAGATLSPPQGAFDPQDNALWHSMEWEFRRYVQYVREQEEKAVKVEAFIWWQGESDHVYASSNPGEYLAALQRLIAAVRRVTGNANLPVVLVMPFKYNLDDGSSGAQNKIRYEQIQVALNDPYVAVSTCAMIPEIYGATKLSATHDEVHVRATVMIAESVRVGQIIRAMKDPADVALAAPANFTADTINANDITFSWDAVVGAREYIICLNDTVVGTTASTSITINGLDAGTSYSARVFTHSLGWKMASSQLGTGTTGSSPVLRSAYDDLIDAGYTDAQAKTFLARRVATNYISTGNPFISDFFRLPAGVSFSNGTTFRDDFFGFKHTIVRTGSVRIKNCEKWFLSQGIQADKDGIWYLVSGSGSATRNLNFYRRGAQYAVNGGSNTRSIVVNGSNSIEADNRANNGWFLTDDLFAFPSSDDTISVINILTGVIVDTHTISGSPTINLNQSDGNDARRAYSNPVMDPIIASYNAANPLTAINDDKVYRLLKVSSDKKQYVILVYTISTGAWTYLTGGATTSESASRVTHTISLNGGTDVDYLYLHPTGLRVGSNTSGQGMNIHYPNGTLIVQLYSNSNHKSIGPIWDDKDLISEKITGSNSDNTFFGVKAGDMVFFTFDPTNETRDLIEVAVMPPEDTSLYAGGDQGSHTGNRIAIYAGHRDNEVDNNNPGREIFKKQMVVMDPAYAEDPTDGSKFARHRFAQLNVTSGGGDAADPGGFPDLVYEDPNNAGEYITGAMWFDTDIAHDGGTGNAVIYTELFLKYDNDDLATIKQALLDNDLETRQ